MPFLDWNIRGSSSPSISPLDDSGPPTMLLATKKRLIRPYSSSHIKASLRRLDRDAILPPRSRTAVRRMTGTAGGGSRDGDRDGGGEEKGNVWIPGRKTPSAGLLRVSPMRTRARSAGCNNARENDDDQEIDYRKIETEDPDRMSESDIYQEVRKLNTKNYEHESLRGGISPSIAQASRKLIASKYAGATTVVRIGPEYHEGLKVTGVPMEVKSTPRSEDDDTFSEVSFSSEDICQCHDHHHHKCDTPELVKGGDGNKSNMKVDGSELKIISKSNATPSPTSFRKTPSSNPKDIRRISTPDHTKSQERKTAIKSMPIARCSSAKAETFSPTTIKIDSANLPIIRPRSITGPRMRYEVASSLSGKFPDDDRDSVCSMNGADLNKQIEAVARAQGIIDRYPNIDERSTKNTEVPIFSWRPALKDMLRSRSVSLRQRENNCPYVDSASPTKCLKHGNKCPELSKMMQNNSIGQYPSSHVSSNGRHLKISIDMRSIRLPPIMNYTTAVQESSSSICAVCIASAC